MVSPDWIETRINLIKLETVRAETPALFCFKAPNAAGLILVEIAFKIRSVMKKGKPLSISIFLNVLLGGAVLLIIAGKLFMGSPARHRNSSPPQVATARREPAMNSEAFSAGNENPDENPSASATQNVAQARQPADQALQTPQAPVQGDDQGVDVPLFFLDPGPSIQADEIQWNAYINLQQRFVDAVGDPNDPGYGERWQKAQEELDSAFHAQFGNDAFNSFLHRRYALQHNNPGAAQPQPPQTQADK